MSDSREYGNIGELLAEAEELVQQVNSGAIRDLEETHRLEIEKYVLELKRIKSEARDKLEQKGKPAKDSGAEGMHEAILDIVKAMQGFANRLS